MSDFINEKNGYLRLTDDEFKKACDQNIVVKREAREYLEYGENKEGYWATAKFLKQIENAITIAEIKYPKSEGYRWYWLGL